MWLPDWCLRAPRLLSGRSGERGELPCSHPVLEASLTVALGDAAVEERLWVVCGKGRQLCMYEKRGMGVGG